MCHNGPLSWHEGLILPSSVFEVVEPVMASPIMRVALHFVSPLLNQKWLRFYKMISHYVSGFPAVLRLPGC